ncbi:MAG: T9SS type A sorting domain-containing protein [Ignavibacteriae bacterium]|nr:T9SS type A sorting domain-containing protein [Ignavibacteriota bacterium]
MFHYLFIFNHFAKDLIKQNLFLLIFFVFFSYNLQAQLVQDFKVNDDTTNYDQLNARMGVYAGGNFVIVWEDYRLSNHSNIFCQLFDSLAHRIGNNFRINSVLNYSSYPYISVRKDGSFAIAWYNYQFKFRLFNKNGTPISNEILLNDNLDCDSSGKFIAALVYNGNVYFQRIDKFGNKIGANVKINDDSGSYGQGFPDITVKQDGSFITCWRDSRPPAPSWDASDIYMQTYDSSGNKIGNNQRVNDILDIQDEEYDPFISSDSTGAFCIIFSRWRFYPNTTYAVIQLYDKYGIKIGSNSNIINSYDAYAKGIRKRKNGDMIIGFTFGSLMRQYIQRRNSSGATIGNTFQMTNQAPLQSNWYCDMALYNNKIISMIADLRNGNGDVFCNIRSFINPDSITGISKQRNIIPTETKLEQNYPNPFNPSTSIKYSLSSITKREAQNVKLIVYDILGKEVVTLVNEKQFPGTYETIFDGSYLSSGVYYYSIFYQNERETKFMILLK